MNFFKSLIFTSFLLYSIAGCEPTPIEQGIITDPETINEMASSQLTASALDLSSGQPVLVQLKNRGTGLFLDGMGLTSNGADCGQRVGAERLTSQWVLSPAGSYFQLINRESSLILDGMGRRNNGAACGQWSNTTHPNSYWDLELFDSIYHRIKNGATGLFLDGMGRTTDGAACGQYGNTAHPNAQWDIIAVDSSFSPFLAVSYNWHGGHTQNGKTRLENAQAFHDALDESTLVVGIQEVKSEQFDLLKNEVFTDFPYRFFTEVKATRWFANLYGGNAFFSKVPFDQTESKLVTIDPQVDKWERKAQYVKMTYENHPIHLFHFHNTYDFGGDPAKRSNPDVPYEAEILGLERYENFIVEKLGSSWGTRPETYILMGDFNLPENYVYDILDEAPNRYRDWVDYQLSNTLMLRRGIINTTGMNISDHDAVYVEYGLGL